MAIIATPSRPAPSMAANPLPHAAAPDFTDPLAMLTACHRRLERELATLDRLQRHLPEHGSDADVAEQPRGGGERPTSHGVGEHGAGW